METSKKRIVLVFIILTGIFVILLGRAVFLQIFPDERVIKKAKDQYAGEVALSPRRGDIFDRNGNPLAISMDFDSLYVDPVLVTDKKYAAELISRELGLDYKEIFNKISVPNKRFVWIKHLLTPQEVKKIEPLFKKERGVRTVKEPKRVYPNT
ncbi:MAG: penicillin-binding protein, partial [bacterium]